MPLVFSVLMVKYCVFFKVEFIRFTGISSHSTEHINRIIPAIPGFEF